MSKETVYTELEDLREKYSQLAVEHYKLLKCVEKYAGHCDRRIAGRPKESWSCQGFAWLKRKVKPNWLEKKLGQKEHIEYVHVYMNNVGMVECGGGPEIAEAVLEELGIE